MLPVEGYVIRHSEIAGVPVVLATYKVGDTFHCIVANDEHGPNVARSTGSSASDALINATREARRRFLQTQARVE